MSKWWVNSPPATSSVIGSSLLVRCRQANAVIDGAVLVGGLAEPLSHAAAERGRSHAVGRLHTAVFSPRGVVLEQVAGPRGAAAMHEQTFRDVLPQLVGGSLVQVRGGLDGLRDGG